MEFVIVAPIYFILLGGIFFLGELGLNRLRLHIADHTGTWLGATRFSSSNIGGFIRKNLFHDTLKLEGTLQVDQSMDGKEVNNFMALYFGKIKELKVSMPDWAKGMFSMQETMANNGKTGLTTQREFTYFSEEQNVFRAACFHRLRNIEPGRGIGASSKQLLNFLGDVVSDNWVGKDEAIEKPQIPSDDGQDLGRTLSEWAE